VEKLQSIVAAKGLVVEAGFMLRFHPNLQWIKQSLEDGAVGRIQYVRALSVRTFVNGGQTRIIGRVTVLRARRAAALFSI
jgi:predicted dehydrogenase